MADETGVSRDRIGRFKELCLEAALRVAAGRPGHGILCDDRLGRRALHAAAGSGLWIGRPAEYPGSRPLRLEPDLEPDYGSALSQWPLEQVVKVLCLYHPDDDADLKAAQDATLIRLARAARANRLELFLEITPSRVGRVTDTTTAEVIARIYSLSIYPRLVEAGADGDRCGLGERLRRNHQERSPLPRDCGSRSRCVSRGSCREFCRRRASRTGQGLRGRPHDILRCRRCLAVRSHRR